MDELLTFFSKWTPGGVGIWTLVAMGLVAWWQGLPKVLDALASRQSKIEERMQLLLTNATERFERELKAADERHADCMEANEKLAQRVNDQDERIARQSRTIAQQGEDLMCAQNTIDGLKKQIVQLQTSAMRVAVTVPSTPSQILEPMLEQLAKIDREDGI